MALVEFRMNFHRIVVAFSQQVAKLRDPLKLSRSIESFDSNGVPLRSLMAYIIYVNECLLLQFKRCDIRLFNALYNCKENYVIHNFKKNILEL